jgi:enoyl-CoA hydratase/carnithine racemase
MPKAEPEVGNDNILFAVRGGAAWITLNRPELRNALDVATMKALAWRLREAQHAEVRCVVLTGSGGNFCGGGDVSVVQTHEDYHQYTASFAAVYDGIAALTKPFITRVAGRATAAGMALVALSDIAIATSDSVFGTPEISHGMFPMMAMGPIAAEVGRKAAWRLFYSGEVIGSRDALALGLLTEIAEGEVELDGRIDDWIACIEKADPRPLALGRQLFYELLDAPKAQAVRLGGKSVLRLLELRQSAPPRADYLVSK